MLSSNLSSNLSSMAARSIELSGSCPKRYCGEVLQPWLGATWRTVTVNAVTPGTEGSRRRIEMPACRTILPPPDENIQGGQPDPNTDVGGPCGNPAKDAEQEPTTAR